MHKAGFVNIIGNPNVGKSTLMNALVGERLSIITSKAQTTRHRILGVVSGEDFQIVFSDTPGILKPSYKLQESMMKFVTGAVNDADVILYVTDTVEQSDRSNDILEKIRQSDIPTLAVINKIDLTTPEKLEELVDKWQALGAGPPAGPDIPPVLFAIANFCRSISIFIPVSVLISDSTSAPPASAARAISVISVTFGLNFIIIGCFAYFLTSLVIASTAFGSCPNAIPPSFTFGHEILISSRSTGSEVNRSTTSQ